MRWDCWGGGWVRPRAAACAACCVAAAAAACASGASVITASGYQHPDYGYGVSALDQGGALLPAGWQIENYYPRSFLGGQPALVAKDGPEYRTRYLIDADGDGDFEVDAEAQAYDLRFEHERHGGVIWVRTTPVSVEWGSRDLRVLARKYVESVSGAGFELVQFTAATVVSRERRWASSVVGEVPATLAGQQAHAVIMDVANVDQLKLDPSHRSARVEFVLARTPYAYVTTGRNPARFPVVLIAGYANQPTDFDASLADFWGLLGRIVMVGRQGFAVEAGPAAVDAAAPPPAASAAP
jgi:hypothetical protein